MNVAMAYKIVEASKNGKKQDVFVFRNGNDTIESIGIEKFRSMMVRNKEAYGAMTNLCIEKILEGMRNIEDDELENLAEDAVYTQSGDDDSDDYVNSDSGPTIVDADEEDIGLSSSVTSDIDTSDL
jgi:hypothetical protein